MLDGSLVSNKYEAAEAELSQLRTYHASFLVGDSGYPLQPRLLTPFANPSTDKERRYNNSLKVTRSVVERTIGTWKSRFRAFCK